MPTRGQRAAAAEQAASQVSSLNGAQVSQVEKIANTSYNDMIDSTLGGSKETIGGRLRKRRRTGSSAYVIPPHPLKRPQSRKSMLTGASGNQNPETSDVKIQGLQEIATKGTQSSVSTLPNEESYISVPKAHIEDSHSSVPQLQMALAVNNEGPSTLLRPSHEAPAGDHTATNFNTVITDIINHGETVENHDSSHSLDEPSVSDTGQYHHLSASYTLRAQSLPVLENLATQILEIMAKSTYHEILTLATKFDTDPGQAYATLKSLFDHTKKVYSAQEPFLNPFELGLVETSQIDIIRKANMATFVSSVFGSQDVGFYHLNENFLDTFVTDGNRLLKSQAQLFLELKTQAYISAVQNTNRSTEEILEDLFPQNFEELLLKRRPGAKQLAPSETDFVQRARNRRRVLLEEAANLEAIKALPEKYVWESFLRDISAFVSKNFEAIAGVAKSPRIDSMPQKKSQARFSQKNHNQPVQQATQADQEALETGIADQAYMASKVAQTAQEAMRDLSSMPTPDLPQYPASSGPVGVDLPTTDSHQGVSQQDTPQIQYHFEHALHPNVPAPPPPYNRLGPYQGLTEAQQQWNGNGLSSGHLHPSFSVSQNVPYPTQSAPTQILYERARMASTAKASPSNRRTGHPSQRRPWTTEEESSLMAGLDRVKGPHWSQILAMFGPGGTINEILKDRNQVQLKDKARNLKLFFLKSGIEVPYYLRGVTGELKTRAPAQAAKNEAKEQGTIDEDRAHVEGLMALASGSVHESDQVLLDSREPPHNTLPNGRVPTADMGVGPRAHGSDGTDVPLDPQFTIGSTKTAPDGIAQIVSAAT